MPKLSFLSFDSLGMIVGMRFKGHTSYRTRLGSCFTFLILIILLTTLVYFMDIYFKGTDYSEIYSNMKYWNSQNVTISDEFEIGILLKVNGQIQKENEFWELEAFFVEENAKSKSIEIHKLSISSCGLEKWSSVKYQSQLLDMTQALCIDISNLSLKGNYNTEVFSYIEIKYRLKFDYNNPDLVIAYNDFIDTNKPVVSLFYTEGSFDVHGYITEITYFINSINVNLSWMDTNFIDIYLSLDEMRKSNDKLFFSELQAKTFFAVENFFQRSFVRPATNLQSAYFKIMSSNTKSVTTINYISFTVIISRIGGVIQSCIIVIMLINRIFSNWLYDLEHINALSKKLLDDNENCNPAIERSTKQIVGGSKMVKPVFHHYNRNAIILNNNRVEDCSVDNLHNNEPSELHVPNANGTLNLNDKLAVNNGSQKGLSTKEIETKVQNLKLIQDTPDIHPKSHGMRKPSNLGSNNLSEIVVIFDNQAKFSLGSMLCYKYSFCLNKCCLSRRRKAVYDFSQAFIQQTFEVSNNYKSYLNTQLLKYLLLNDNQLMLFENVSLVNMRKILKKIEASSNSSSNELRILASGVSDSEYADINKRLVDLFFV